MNKMNSSSTLSHPLNHFPLTTANLEISNENSPFHRNINHKKSNKNKKSNKKQQINHII